MMRHFHRLQPRRWGFGRALPLLPALSPPFGDAPQFCGKTDAVRAEPPAAFSGVAARFRQRAERERSRSFVGPSVFAPPPQPAGQDGKNRLPPLLPPPSEIGAKACPLPRSACADRGLFSAGLNAHASERGAGRAADHAAPASSDCGIRCRTFRQCPGRSRTTSGGNRSSKVDSGPSGSRFSPAAPGHDVGRRPKTASPGFPVCCGKSSPQNAGQ